MPEFTTEEITEWSRYIIELILSGRPIQGPGILISKRSGGYFFEIDPKAGGGDSYQGPFKVVKKNDTNVTIMGYDVSKEQFIHNYIIAGLSRFEDTGDTDKGVSGNGVIYAKITHSGSYAVEYLFATSLPAQTNGNVYVSLADIRFSSGKITKVTQIQFGEIHIAGRLV